MTITEQSSELSALRELADDIFATATESAVDVQQLGLPFDTTLWDNLNSSGLALLTADEALGGSGAGLRELAVLLESAGYHAAPVPLAEHDLLAAWLVQAAALALPEGPMTAALTSAEFQGDQLTTTLAHVPWATAARTVLLLGPGFVAAIPTGRCVIGAGTDIAGQPSSSVQIDLTGAQIARVATPLDEEFRLRGAWARAVQTAGALARVVELSCAHVQQREQFGRPIAKFQAVQALISDAAGASAMAKTAADFATDIAAAQGFTSDAARFAIAVAKIESARAATLVARNAHQAHGAIGFTLDHRLRHFTNRALAWRAEFGSQLVWQDQLGQLAIRSNLPLWTFVTSRSAPTEV